MFICRTEVLEVGPTMPMSYLQGCVDIPAEGL